MSITLADVVTLLHRPLLSLLWTKDLTALYVSCGHSLPEDVRFEYRDYLAMQELDLLAVNNSCHFGAKCELDWYQLTPVEIEGALEDFECPCFKTVKYSEYPRYEPPDILPLPRILDAPAKLLEAGRLVRTLRKLVEPTWGRVLELADLDEPDKFRFGTFQPMMFSLTNVLEGSLHREMPRTISI
ncbi:hypothetical protein PF007_g28428 [Phytophthora fragariae]|uniref:Uncharacterized protein n=1 Tax=Phytophthora fragariae TaxID=53985 RepID=A0A6A3Q0W5_9STRA|nr:hypothetical protein PF007_g28428 [Phytophthora fragariae]